MDSLFATVAVPHATAAREILGRLQCLYARGLSAADSLSRREQALLHHLSGTDREHFSTLQDADEAFLYWCAHLLEAHRISRQGQLAEEVGRLKGDGRQHRDSHQAEVEQPSPELQRVLQALLDWLRQAPSEAATGGWRALLWGGIWTRGKEMVHLPSSSLFWPTCADLGIQMAPAEVQTALSYSCPSLRAAVVDYAARCRVPIGQFAYEQEDKQLRYALLRYKLVMGELQPGDLPVALGADCDYMALGLRAAVGDPGLPDLLAHRLEHDAARVLPLAALSGRRAAGELLLEALANPRFSHFAEAAWQLLSGRILPLQPQMRVAGRGRQPQALVRVGYTPDVQQARRWWREFSCLFDESPNGLLLGEPLTDRTMLLGLHGYGGCFIGLLLEIALLRLGWKTVGLSAQQPCHSRRAKLREMSETCLN